MSIRRKQRLAPDKRGARYGEAILKQAGLTEDEFFAAY